MFLGDVDPVTPLVPQKMGKEAQLSCAGLLHDLEHSLLICFSLMNNKTELSSEKLYKKLKCSLVTCELNLGLPPHFNTAL